NFSASCWATSRSTSNSLQTLRVTISDNGVRPSAACQMAVATSFSVKNVESTDDIPSFRRPACGRQSPNSERCTSHSFNHAPDARVRHERKLLHENFLHELPG